VIWRGRSEVVKEGGGNMSTNRHRMIIGTIKWCSTDGGRFDRLPGGSETAGKVPSSDHLS